VVEDFDEGMLQGSAVRNFNDPFHFPMGLLLDENDNLIATPMSGFSFFGVATLAIAENGRH
jgi:hypothetical protein